MERIKLQWESTLDCKKFVRSRDKKIDHTPLFKLVRGEAKDEEEIELDDIVEFLRFSFAKPSPFKNLESSTQLLAFEVNASLLLILVASSSTARMTPLFMFERINRK
jgi:hypothetical protein